MLKDGGVLSMIWLEDALAYCYVPTAVFDLYLLVPDVERAARILSDRGYTPEPHSIYSPLRPGSSPAVLLHCRLVPPGWRESPPEDLSWMYQTPVGDPPPERPAPVVLLDAAQWGVYEAEGHFDDDFRFAPLDLLLKGLITALLLSPDSRDGTDWQMHLMVMISHLYAYNPVLKHGCFAFELPFQLRRFHRDIVTDALRWTISGIRNARKVARERRQPHTAKPERYPGPDLSETQLVKQSPSSSDQLRHAAAAVARALGRVTSYALAGGSACVILGSVRQTDDVCVVVPPGATRLARDLFRQKPELFRIDSRTQDIYCYPNRNSPKSVRVEIHSPALLGMENPETFFPNSTINVHGIRVLKPALLLETKCGSFLQRVHAHERLADAEDIIFLLWRCARDGEVPTRAEAPTATPAFVTWFVADFKHEEAWEAACFEFDQGMNE